MHSLKLKTVAFMLSFVMVATSTYSFSNVNASELQSKTEEMNTVVELLKNSDIDVNKQVISEIDNDIQDLEKVGMLSEGKLLNVKEEAGKYIYELQFQDVYNEVEVLESNEKTRTLHCVQPDSNSEDTVEFRANGDIILDGKKVECEIGENVEKATPRYSNYSTAKTYKSCPYGKAGDYTILGGKKNVVSINFKKTIVNMTISAISSIMLGFLTASIWSSIVGSVAAEGVLSWLQREKSTTKYLSVKAKYYYHKNTSGKGYVPQVNKEIKKVVGQYYEKENYKGSSYTRTRYRVIDYNL